jgi:hypothetical protein
MQSSSTLVIMEQNLEFDGMARAWHQSPRDEQTP